MMLSSPTLNGRLATGDIPFVSSARRCKLLVSSRSFGAHSLPLFTSRTSCQNRFSLRASSLPQVSELPASSPDGPHQFSVKIPVGDRHILIETGHMGRQASGAVTVTDGETIVYTTVCLADIPNEPSDFFPLSVNYQERFSAAGRTSGGFFKREGRAKDHEVLVCRLIDRPLRPTMPKGFYHDTQILSWVLSYDGLHAPDSLAVTAAGIAVALSELPNAKPVAGVRVGLVGGNYVVNPTTKEMEDSELDLVLAGTKSGILMIEGYCNFLPEEKLLEAIEVGQAAVKAICTEVEALVSKFGKPKMLDAIKLPPPELYTYVEEIAGDDLLEALQIKNKQPRRKALAALEERVVTILSEKGYICKDSAGVSVESMSKPYDDLDEDEEVVVDGEVDEGDIQIKPTLWKSAPLLYSDVDVKLVFKEVSSKYLRKRIVQGGKRSDGRTPDEIRSINSRCRLLPRAHGSALFTRGETQALAVVTLGDKYMAQRIDNLEGDDEAKRFYLQYSFPPSSVGEAGRIGAPSRREIGHGTLAERALKPILPSEDEFPYTIRVESSITESNGSSSMASVCGGCLALQDAGVPVKRSIAGIAMGMVLDTEECGGDGTPLILSDITGAEDASGDMDFKVAGSEDGITAFQLDIKVAGIQLPVMEQALRQAKDGRRHIIAEMMKCSPPPAKKLSQYAPIICVMKVRPDKLSIIIGPGGKKVKSIIEEAGVESIDTLDDGTVRISGRDLPSLEKAKVIINNLIMVPKVGDIYRNCEIKTVAPYGVFVEIAPGKEGLCHISELSSGYLPKAEDVFKVGDQVDVKLIEVNEKGQLRLSRRALLPDGDDPLVPNTNKNVSNGDAETKYKSSAEDTSVDGDMNPPGKFVRRQVVKSSSNRTVGGKGRPKTNSTKKASSDEPQTSNLVNEEANIG